MGSQGGTPETSPAPHPPVALLPPKALSPVSRQWEEEGAERLRQSRHYRPEWGWAVCEEAGMWHGSVPMGHQRWPHEKVISQHLGKEVHHLHLKSQRILHRGNHPWESPEAVLILAPKTAKISVGLNPSEEGGDKQGIRSQKQISNVWPLSSDTVLLHLK